MSKVGSNIASFHEVFIGPREMHMLQECLRSVLQHELNVVGFTTAPSGLAAQDSKAAFLGGFGAPA